MVLIQERGVWPSNEELFLYDLLCRKHFRVAAVESTPGHLIESHEHEDGVALLFLALCFGWGGSVFGDGQRRAVHFDHDGVIWLTGAESETECMSL